MIQFLKKNILFLFLFFYFIIGSFNSINTGISFDEYHEQKNWNFHVKYTKKLSSHIFLGENFDEKLNEEYIVNYLGYGIGFQIISQPIQSLLKDSISKLSQINDYGAHLTAKHFVVFLFFFLSGIFLYLILKKIINDKFFCSTTLALYLLYPYLFGQSMFSPKDIPFMSVWLMCTFISFYLFDLIIKNNKLNYLSVFFFSLSTAYLLSIRIAGILILFQYLITFIIYLSSTKASLISFFKKFYLKILFFSFTTLLFTMILYPPCLLDPSLFFLSIDRMASYFNDVCTNTLGSCMHPKNLPSTYIPIWLMVKLPFFIIFGIFLLPIVEKKIFIDTRKNIFFGTIVGSSLFIPLLLIIRKVHLYDELRQVMFIVPLLFILGSVSLYYFSKRIFYVLAVIMICIFTIENIKINPYQYVWFNLPSRFIDLTKKFELEYQGISGREIAKKISLSNNDNLCILVNPEHTVKPYLNPTRYNCFAIWQAIDTNYKRPFLAVQHVRNIKKGKSYKCKTIYKSNFTLLFHKKRFVTGKLLKCT